MRPVVVVLLVRAAATGAGAVALATAGGDDETILWVAREAPSEPAGLTIAAQRMEGTEAVGESQRRVVEGGPGPSTIDLPAPGCWRLTLRRGSSVDALDLQYRQDPG
ncbi:MAG TPA: hypothetical protein VHJ39_00530 [Solirubrobacteraceae bacterium]|nr:hypothetical protein [Solirubrobacteraceae bacterium]